MRDHKTIIIKRYALNLLEYVMEIREDAFAIHGFATEKLNSLK